MIIGIWIILMTGIVIYNEAREEDCVNIIEDPVIKR